MPFTRRQSRPITNTPDPPRTPGLPERTTAERFVELLGHSRALKHLSDLQRLAFYWKDMYERLYGDYVALCSRYHDECAASTQANADAADMSRAIQRKDGLIALLQARVRVMEAEAEAAGETTGETTGEPVDFARQDEAGEESGRPADHASEDSDAQPSGEGRRSSWATL